MALDLSPPDDLVAPTTDGPPDDLVSPPDDLTAPEASAPVRPRPAYPLGAAETFEFGLMAPPVRKSEIERFQDQLSGLESPLDDWSPATPRVKPPPPATFLGQMARPYSELWKGLRAGTYDVGAIGAGFGEVASNVLDWKGGEDAFRSLWERFSRETQGVQETMRAPQLADIEDMTSFVDWLAGSTGRGAPQLGGSVLAYMAGGLPGMALFSYGMGASQAAGSIKKEGMSLDDPVYLPLGLKISAGELSALTGVPLAAIEFMGGPERFMPALFGRLAEPLVRNTLVKIGAAGLKAAGVEGTEEILQQWVSDGVARAASGGPFDAQWFKETTIEGLKQAAAIAPSAALFGAGAQAMAPRAGPADATPPAGKELFTGEDVIGRDPEADLEAMARGRPMPPSPEILAPEAAKPPAETPVLPPAPQDVPAHPPQQAVQPQLAPEAPAATPSPQEAPQQAAQPPVEQPPADLVAPPELPAAPPLPPIETRPIKQAEAVTSAGRRVPVEYALVEADALIPSNLADLRPNPAYPADLQPRDRTRISSELQITRILNPERFQPDMLGETPDAANGAPVVGEEGFVESGNMRAIALRRAYAENGAVARKYREWLTRQGYPAEGMRAPVLVRVNRGKLSMTERAAFAIEANKPAILQMSPQERAGADARLLSDDVLGLAMSGDLTLASNRPFLSAILKNITTPDELAGLLTGDGQVSTEGLARARNALLARAYGAPDIVGTLTENPDSNIRMIGTALTEAAPFWAQMRTAAERGNIPAEYDLTDNLMEAVRLIGRARSEEVSITDLLAQADAFSGQVSPTTESMLRWMLKGKNLKGRIGAPKMADALSYFAQEAMKATAGADLLGQRPEGRLPELMEKARVKAQGAPEGEQLTLTPPMAQPGRAEGVGPRPGEGGEQVRGSGDQGRGQPARGGREQGAAVQAEGVEPASTAPAAEPSAREAPATEIPGKLGELTRVVATDAGDVTVTFPDQMHTELYDIGRILLGREKADKTGLRAREKRLFQQFDPWMVDYWRNLKDLRITAERYVESTEDLAETGRRYRGQTSQDADLMIEPDLVAEYWKARSEGRGMREPAAEPYRPATADFPVDATGDVVVGDTIRFQEGVFGGSFRKPTFVGNRTIEAEVVRDSYGADKQQHTFTLRVLRSEGAEPLAPGTTTRRKGRNVYRNGTQRQRWADETAREGARTEKHGRGDAARTARAQRREEGLPYQPKVLRRDRKGRPLKRAPAPTPEQTDRIERAITDRAHEMVEPKINLDARAAGTEGGDDGEGGPPRPPQGPGDGAPPPGTPDSAGNRRATAQGWIARGQPLDRAMRMPFDWFGGINARGEWQPGGKMFQKAANALVTAKFSDDGRFRFLNPMLESARRGLIDRYGLDPEYVHLERGRTQHERELAQKGLDVLNRLKDAGVKAAEAEVLHKMLTGQEVSAGDMGRLAAPIRMAIDEMGAEAVSLGLVSPESYERNRGAYLHRVYQKHEAEQPALSRWFSRYMTSKRKKLIGDEMKARGIFYDVDLKRLMKDVPGYLEARRGKPVKGERFRVLDKLSGQDSFEGIDAGPAKIERRVFLPADQDVPEQFRDFTDRGVWEVRQIKGDTLVLWRDYTPEERRRGGEITDARYTIGKTFMLLSHDLATGRFYKDISENADWSQGTPPSGRWVDAADFRRLWEDPTVEWVRVPDTAIPDTGGKKRWGALAGRWVRSEIWRDLNELDLMQNPNTWTRLLRIWKTNRTARSPVTHANNILSNFMLMDMADIRLQDFVRGVRSYIREDADFQEARDHGAFGADIITQEIKRGVLEPVLREIQEQAAGVGKNPVRARFGVLQKVAEAIWSKAMAIDQGLVRAYQMEDELFRMGLYLRRRDQGDAAEDAALEARQQFIDYDIRAPWVNAARRSVLPFIAYTYRAAPMIARTVAVRPWKVAKFFLIAQAMNMIAYMMEPGDEDEERRVMREADQGYTWIQTPRMMRMPYRDANGNPVFLDIRRWIPGGDIFDFNQNHGMFELPAPLQWGGPLMLAFELALNKSAFTGEPIHNEMTDDFWDRMAARGDYIYKAWMPSAAWVPGSWYWDKIGLSLKGAMDSAGRPYSLPEAVASSFGIKLKPQDVEENASWRSREFDKQRRALAAEQRRYRRLLNRGILSESAFDDAMKSLDRKRDRLDEKESKVFTKN